jgi:hypothetical protein
MHLKVSDPESYKYDVIDVNTGVRIPMVIEANDETGEYEIYMFDENNMPKMCGNNYLTEKRKGNIKLVKKEE